MNGATRPEDTACRPVSVLLADDNPVVRIGLRSLLETAEDIVVVGEAHDGRAAVTLTEQLRPDIVLLDVRMPHMDGVTALSYITPHAKVLMLTHSEDPDVVRTALSAGASGYLVHGASIAEVIVSAVRSTVRGSSVLAPVALAALQAPVVAATAPPVPASSQDRSGTDGGLTSREAEIMDLVADGRTNREIARACFVAEKTVKNHLNRIFAKLGSHSRTEAVLRWQRLRGPRP